MNFFILLFLLLFENVNWKSFLYKLLLILLFCSFKYELYSKGIFFKGNFLLDLIVNISFLEFIICIILFILIILKFKLFNLFCLIIILSFIFLKILFEICCKLLIEFIILFRVSILLSLLYILLIEYVNSLFIIKNLNNY